MTQALIFIVLLVLAALLAVWRGGAPERFTSAAMLIGAAATALANANTALGFRGIEWQLFWIDAAVLGAFVAIAMYADRFWPLWLAALQCIAVAAHGARAFDPDILPIAYWWLIGKLAYPMILILCIGIERHHRRTHHSSWPHNPNAPGSELASPDIAHNCQQARSSSEAEREMKGDRRHGRRPSD